MKKNIFSVALAGLALLSLGSCSESDYDSKYQDPSATNVASVPDVFTAVLKEGNTWMNPMYYRYYCQTTTSAVFSGLRGDANTKGRFQGAGEARYNDRWKQFYNMLTQHRLLTKVYNETDDAQKPNTKVFYICSRTIINAQLHEMLSLFGAVPYNGACTLWENSDYAGAKEKDVYESDVDLYKQILAELKESADFFASEAIPTAAQTSLKNKDITVAAGRTEYWQRYVNSLRLRIALHLATNGDLAAEAKATIKEVVENPAKYPVIESNDQNMGIETSTVNDDFNFGKSLSQALHGGYSPSPTYLKALNVPADGMPDANTDPRISVLLDCNPDGAYITFDLTKSNSEISNLEQEKQQAYIANGITGAKYYCTFDSTAYAGIAEYNGNMNTFGLWISAAEVSLSKAEAYVMGYGVAKDEAKAKECFVNGIKLSTEYYWNVKEGSSFYDRNNPNDSYYSKRALVRPTVADVEAYANAIWAPTQEAVCTQLWLNFNWTNYLEGWNVVRRTGYPAVEFAKDGIIVNYPTPPGRLPYPSSELTYNAQNCQDAIKKYYKEPLGYYTTLFWAKEVYYKLNGTSN